MLQYWLRKIASYTAMARFLLLVGVGFRKMRVARGTERCLDEDAHSRLLSPPPPELRQRWPHLYSDCIEKSRVLEAAGNKGLQGVSTSLLQDFTPSP